MITLRGRIIECDQYKRVRLEFPDLQNGVDSKNTRAILTTWKENHPSGWCPVNGSSYLVKIQPKTFAYAGSELVTLSSLIGKNVEIEVKISPFTDKIKGWYIQLHSVRTI